MFATESIHTRHREPCGTKEALVDDSLSLVGSVIDGRYLVERAIGHGGYGIVYRATHLRFDSPVALKILRIPAHANREDRARFVAGFAEEGKLAFQLGALHPGIVRVFEAGTLERRGAELAPYLAMEWLDGIPLTRLLAPSRSERLPAVALPAMMDLLDLAVQGLSTAHRSRVAHCDVKPGNLFVCNRDGRKIVKVLDFGLARVVIDSATASRPSGSASPERGFTAAYAAPEQWCSRLGRTGPWTDVHALALVCSEILSGRPPFATDDPRQLLAACLDESARPTPGQLGADVSAPVESVFERALAVSPKERFQNAAEFWQALRNASASTQSLAPSRSSPRPLKRRAARSHASHDPREHTANTAPRTLESRAEPADLRPQRFGAGGARRRALAGQRRQSKLLWLAVLGCGMLVHVDPFRRGVPDVDLAIPAGAGRGAASEPAVLDASLLVEPREPPGVVGSTWTVTTVVEQPAKSARWEEAPLPRRARRTPTAVLALPPARPATGSTESTDAAPSDSAPAEHVRWGIDELLHAPELTTRQ